MRGQSWKHCYWRLDCKILSQPRGLPRRARPSLRCWRAATCCSPHTPGLARRLPTSCPWCSPVLTIRRPPVSALSTSPYPVVPALPLVVRLRSCPWGPQRSRCWKPPLLSAGEAAQGWGGRGSFGAAAPAARAGARPHARADRPAAARGQVHEPPRTLPLDLRQWRCACCQWGVTL